MTNNNQDNEQTDEYLIRLNKHADNLRAVKMYSMQRIDLLIISICTAGIYSCFEILKYTATNDLFKNYIDEIKSAYKFSGIIFTSAILINFVSQWTAYKGSSYALASTNMEIESVKYDVDKKDEIIISDKKGEFYNCITNKSNIASIALMFLGLIWLAISICYHF